MKIYLAGFSLMCACAVWAQSTVSADEIDGQAALAILEELEGAAGDLEQVDQLGKLSEKRYANLLFLDRLNAKVKPLQIAKDQEIVEQYLTIKVKACFSTQGANDAVAYLVIQDEREAVPSFEGWMIASSPALSAMDHSRYDVWVEGCTDEGAPISEEGLKLPPARDESQLSEVITQ